MLRPIGQVAGTKSGTGSFAADVWLAGCLSGSQGLVEQSLSVHLVSNILLHLIIPNEKLQDFK